MGKTIITADAFPEIIEQYNSGGKSSAYRLIRDKYNIRNPYSVLKRIRECGEYVYDPGTDQFSGHTAEESKADNVFIGLDELCGHTSAEVSRRSDDIRGGRPEAMQSLVRELISDRLLMLSKYITLDTSARTILIDQASLTADGYQIVTY